MGFFGNLAKLAMDVIETPVAIVKDVATMGSQLTDEGKPYIQRKLEDMQDDWDGMKKSISEDADGR